jgi:hypothetical protein
VPTPQTTNTSIPPTKGTTLPPTNPNSTTGTPPKGADKTTPGPKTVPKTSAPIVRFGPTPQQAVAALGGNPPSTSTHGDSLELTNRPIHPNPPTTSHTQTPQQNQTNSQTNNQQQQDNSQQQNNQQQNNNDQQDNNQNNNNQQNQNPYQNQVQQAERAADEAATARDNAASAWGSTRAAHRQAQHHQTSTQRSANDALGAVVGTEAALTRANQRAQDAQRDLTTATQLRDDLANQHDQAADNLAAGRADTNPERADATVRRWGPRVRALSGRLDTANTTVNRANQNHTTARADAAATQLSVNAARAAHTDAQNAVNRAQQAVTTTAAALQQAANNRDIANNAANNANTAVDTVRAAADTANNLRIDANNRTNLANLAHDAVTDLTETRDGLTNQITAIDDQLTAIQQQPADQRDMNQQHALEEQRQQLDNQRADLPITDAVTRANQLTNEATQADNRHNDAVRDLTANVNQVTPHRDTARNAETAANTHRDTAQQAAKDAEKAKDDATTAAAQGAVERGLTTLSGLPPGSQLTIETLGPLDSLVDAITTITGQNRDTVNNQITQLGPDGLANAINDGTIHVGDVDVTITADVHRPADTRTAPQHQQPAATKKDTSAESGNPLSESTSSSLPIRVPLLFVSPIDAAGAAIRPMVYVGATAKRSQNFSSSTTVSSSTSTEQTAHVPTTIAITATVPGQAPVVAPVDAGLRLPSVTPGRPMHTPVPQNGFGTLTPAPVTVPPAFTNLLGTSPDAARGLHDQLLTQNQNPVQVDVNGVTVPITPTGNPTLTYVGTASVDHSNSTSHTNSSSTTRGSDVNFGAGIYGGKKDWFIGAFTDFGSGLSDGTNPANEHSSSHTSGDTELVYRVDRPMRVGDGAHGVQDTVSSTVQVPVPLARSLGLPLPPHLTGSQPVPATQNQQNQQNQQPEYIFGKDNITSVNTTDVVDFIADGIGDKGRDAVADKFSTPQGARDAIYNAMHGGEQAIWQEGGRTHVVDIHARPAPPTSTDPSGKTSAGSEDKNADQFRRTYDSKRTARVGIGGAHLPTGTDSPNANPPKTTPAEGNPNPYQGGPTTSGGAPRASVAGSWESGYGNKSGYTGEDGRASSYDGDVRDFDGPLDFVVVHRSTKTPNWAQRFFLGDRMLFGPDAANRVTEPTKAEIDQAFTGNQPPAANIHTGRVDDAIQVSTASDKLPWATKPLPQSQMDPGVYLGAPPPLSPDTVTINPKGLGDFTNVEHVRITPNTTEGVYVALAKRVEPVLNGQPDPGAVTRIPPKGSGTWSSWGQRTFTEARDNGDGTRTVTTYTYKNSEMTRPGTTSGDAVRDFVGRVGSRGTASQGIGGQSNSTGKMIQPGRMTDFNGELTATSEYSSPRLVDVRADGTLKRNQAGDHIAGSTKSHGVAIDGEVSLGVAPKRSNGTGALLRGVFGGGWKSGGSHAVDLTSGGKQAYDYKGPTAFVAMDVRYTYNADMNLRNVFKTNTFDPVPVTVDQPDGVLVEMPVAHAIDLFTNAGLPVPPELTGALPDAKSTVDNPAQTLLPQGTDYASHSDTTVIRANLNGDQPLAPVAGKLTDLGVTSNKWRAEILGQVDKMLNTPTGHVWLRDVLVGDQGNGGLISVPNPGVALEDVVDIRVTATPSDRTPSPQQPRPLVPDKQSNADYVSTSVQDKKNTTWNVAGAVEAGMNHREVPSVPPGTPDENGVIQQAKPNTGASSGTLTPQIFGASKSWKTDEVLPTSGSDTVNTQVDTDKVGRTGHEVDYQLSISRRRSPMPAVDTPLLGLPKHLNLDKPAGDPVVIEGSVDLVSPSSDASPPLTKPAQAPTFEVVPTRPDGRTPMFGPKDGWRIESIGSDTVQAIHDGAYAQLSDKQLPVGQHTPEAVADSAARESDYTRPGSNAEYVVHTRTNGTSLHNGANAIFTSDNYHVENMLGRKHTLYDSLFDLTVTADFRPDSFHFVAPLPTDTTMNLSQDTESGRPTGTTKTVSTSYGPSLPWSAGNTYGSSGPGPMTVASGPPVSEGIGRDNTTATSAKTGESTGVKHSGRSYLFTADADFYTEANRHGSNWTQGAITSTWDGIRGHEHHADSVMKIGSTDDLHVRVWENTALDKGLLTLADVWHHGGKQPADGFTVTRNDNGGTLHPTGQPAPTPPADAPRGRNLHIAPGVAMNDVRSFVETLPKDMRPTNYTVDQGAPFTANDIHDTVANLPEPAATPTPVPTTTPPTNQHQTGHTDALGGITPEAVQPTEVHPPDHDTTPEPRPGKRSRDEFEADDGPVTTPEPPRTRPVPEQLVAPAPEDTAALLEAVPPGTRFADPASFVELINGTRSDQGRNVNCVDAALAFHATYHGDPRVAGLAPDGVPRSAATAAAEELSYAPEMFSRGPAGLAEIVDRITRAGHGADALVFGFPRTGQGHAWNVVNHHGAVSIVDAQDGTMSPSNANPLPGLDRVYAIPLDADGNFITDEPAPPPPPVDPDPYAAAEHARAVQVHEMRAAAAAGEEIPVPGTTGKLVPSLGGLRLVGATVAADFAATLASLTGRDVIALVIGPDAEYPEFLRFIPGGRPLPV